MILSIIVAVSDNQVIGSGNQLPWHLPADLHYFKTLTTGHPIIMGRKTFESIGRPLPRRENIVVTRDPGFAKEGIHVVHSLEEAVQCARSLGHEEAFIIGGDSIYQQAMALAQKVYLTRVHTIIPHGDAFFPVLDEQHWTLRSARSAPADEKNPLDCTFEVYEKSASHS